MQTTGIIKKKEKGEKIIALTAYDYWTSLLLNEAGIDIILVGDSLGMVMLGYKNTIPVTMDEMIHHTKAVVRGNKTALVVGDMPFMSANAGISDAVRNAGRFIKEGGAGAVKIEGGAEKADVVQAIVEAGIPVMGHIGLRPQNVLMMGGYKRQSDKDKLITDASALQEAGAFSIVLECVSDDIARSVTEKSGIPTIGIGSGRYCGGQILVIHDLLGLCPELTPKFVRPYVNLKPQILDAIGRWKDEISK